MSVLRSFGPAVAYQIQAMLDPKNPSFMVIMAHWPQKGKFHACVCVFNVGHPPCLMAPCCVQRPALSCSLLSHSLKNKCEHTVGEIFGVSLNLIPSTIHHHCICCSGSQSWKLIIGVVACGALSFFLSHLVVTIFSLCSLLIFDFLSQPKMGIFTFLWHLHVFFSPS